MHIATALMLVAAALPPQSDAGWAQSRSADTVVVHLDALVRAAMSQNLDVLTAATGVRESAAYRSSTRSRFDPVISLGGDPLTGSYGGQLVGGLPTGGQYLVGSVAPTTLPGEPVYPNALVASVTQPVLRGFGLGSVRNVMRAADEGAAAGLARYSRVRDQVTAQVSLAYNVLIERQRQEAIAARSLERAEELSAAYAELRLIDKITEVDLITAQLGVASRRARLLSFRRDREEAQDALTFRVYGAGAAERLAGENTFIMPADTAIDIPALGPLDQTVARALETRPDVVAARRDLSRSTYESAYSRNAKLPALNLFGAITSTLEDSLRRPLNAGIFDGRRTEWTFGIELSRPIGNTHARADAERAAAAETRAGIAVADAENIARADVRSAYRDIGMRREHVRIAAEAAQLARRQYEGERARLDLGLTDIFRVLQYDDQVAEVEHAEATAWLALASSVVQYRAATGEIGKSPER
jgi:outer membrane protein TolC